MLVNRKNMSPVITFIAQHTYPVHKTKVINVIVISSRLVMLSYGHKVITVASGTKK